MIKRFTRKWAGFPLLSNGKCCGKKTRISDGDDGHAGTPCVLHHSARLPETEGIQVAIPWRRDVDITVRWWWPRSTLTCSANNNNTKRKKKNSYTRLQWLDCCDSSGKRSKHVRLDELNTKFLFFTSLFGSFVCMRLHMVAAGSRMCLLCRTSSPQNLLRYCCYTLFKNYTLGRRREGGKRREGKERSIFYQAMNRRERGGEKEGVYIYIYICIYPSASNF